MLLEFRYAGIEDRDILAEMNRELINDEGHSNNMDLHGLTKRMTKWLKAQYSAAIFLVDSVTAGYALYKYDSDWIYLRQFYVKPEFRREGVGRNAIQWLRDNPWKEEKSIRLEVLTGNDYAWGFWQAVGFKDYCVTMELKN